jgi:hypothetical protein
MAGEDFFGGEKQGVGREALSFRKIWVKGFRKCDDLVNQFDVWRHTGQLAASR